MLGSWLKAVFNPWYAKTVEDEREEWRECAYLMEFEAKELRRQRDHYRSRSEAMEKGYNDLRMGLHKLCFKHKDDRWTS